jgi:hypothetical protein
MPRANRHFLPGHVWHLTHRCHERDFLFKFARAWADISGRLPNDFKELRRLIAEEYKSDPKDWGGDA